MCLVIDLVIIVQIRFISVSIFHILFHFFFFLIHDLYSLYRIDKVVEKKVSCEIYFMFIGYMNKKYQRNTKIRICVCVSI